MVGRWAMAMLGSAVLAAGAGQVLAAERGPIPIERDLRRWNEIDGPTDRTGSIGSERNVTPTNPSGIPGFSGAPGIIGDSVNSYSPLPPGAPGNEETW